MKYDLILAGVGGQGILSIAFVLDHAALLQGLNFKQAEVHGMAQRGGAVQSHWRLSDAVIYSDLIPKGSCDLILSVEPLEALRYIDYLSPEGRIVTSSAPFINIPDYPNVEEILAALKEVKNSLVVDAERMAKEAGSGRAQNMVMLGAAAPFLPLEIRHLRKAIEELFSSRGEKLVAVNLKAFELGWQESLKSLAASPALGKN
ncbi:MAG: indolepyruvate oxidoreductase subunit beta [Candidatus Aminicenantales bacterium]